LSTSGPNAGATGSPDARALAAGVDRTGDHAVLERPVRPLIDRRTRDGDMVTLALNITSTMRRERALKRAREKAEAANRAKSAFLANMSHEIRTPMNGVVGMADILLETPLTEDQRLYIQTIRNSGEALLSIINDVLDYSKIEARRLTLHPRPSTSRTRSRRS
jgi:signal transduction histidine kinase